jgi:predicted transcriptional regulator
VIETLTVSKKQDDWVSVRLSSEERAELERVARDEERSVSGMIRLAVRHMLETRKAAA